MRPGDEPDDSILKPFVRYKQHVDSTFASALDNMFGPSGFHPRQADSTEWHNTPQPLSSQIRSLFWSPYNPTKLRDLPQPVPKDLPRGAEPILTFEDAFEDLLAVSQGHPLPDIHQKLSQRRLLNQVFPRGEPPMFWMRRLDSQGLVPWLNRDDHETREKADLQRQPPKPKPEDWERLRSELAQRREETWNAEPRDATRAENMLGLNDLLKLSVELLRSNPELEKHMKGMAQSVLEDVFGRDQSPRREANSRDEHHDSEQPKAADRKYPATFDELFEHVQSFQYGGSSPWEAFTKSLDSGREIVERMAGLPKDEEWQRRPRELDERVPVDRSKEFGESESQQESSTEYYSHRQVVGEDGKIRIETSWRKLDGQGNEIDRFEDSQVHESPQELPKDAAHVTQTEHHRGYPADNGEVRKPGWFWK